MQAGGKANKKIHDGTDHAVKSARSRCKSGQVKASRPHASFVPRV